MNDNKYVEFEDPFINACVPLMDRWCKWVHQQVPPLSSDVDVASMCAPTAGNVFEQIRSSMFTNKQD